MRSRRFDLQTYSEFDQFGEFLKKHEHTQSADEQGEVDMELSQTSNFMDTTTKKTTDPQFPSLNANETTGAWGSTAPFGVEHFTPTAGPSFSGMKSRREIALGMYPVSNDQQNNEQNRFTTTGNSFGITSKCNFTAQLSHALSTCSVGKEARKNTTHNFDDNVKTASRSFRRSRASDQKRKSKEQLVLKQTVNTILEYNKRNVMHTKEIEQLKRQNLILENEIKMLEALKEQRNSNNEQISVPDLGSVQDQNILPNCDDDNQGTLTAELEINYTPVNTLDTITMEIEIFSEKKLTRNVDK